MNELLISVIVVLIAVIIALAAAIIIKNRRLSALKRSIDFVEEKGGTLDPESVAAYEYAKEHLQEP